jgi:hypothetical protein
MQYKVPQDVQREDQILWFITLRQLIILMVGFGMSYMLFVNFKQNYDLNELENILVWIPAVITLAFAFLKIHGITLFKFILLLLEQVFFRAPRRHWMAQSGEPFVSITTPFSSDKAKKKIAVNGKEFSTEKVKNLAALLDGEKTKKITQNDEKKS